MRWLEWLNRNVFWGVPMLVLMLGCGSYLTVMTKGILFRRWKTIVSSTVLSLFDGKKRTKSGVTPFQAVSTALAGTVGTGNIIGVSVAVVQGGPGSVFWMWVSALIGMMTKFSEVTLAVAYRKKKKNGAWCGGPMYYIRDGVGSKCLSACFCFFGVLCSFGIGNMVQSNAMAEGLAHSFAIPGWVTGLVTAVVAGLVLIGGMQRISKVTSFFVPFMAAFYMIGAGIVLIRQHSGLCRAFAMIFRNAFQKNAVGAGVTGFGLSQSIRIGLARGVFTNEAGLGSAPIVHAAADTDHPVRQGMWGAFEVFFDTIVMCTVTALVLLSSDFPLHHADDMIVHQIFSNAFPGGKFLIPIGLTLFAFASVIAWYYYGETCFQYLVGEEAVSWYRGLYILLIFVGSVAGESAVWETADCFNALMAIPNLIALLFLGKQVRELSRDFFA